MLKTVIKIENLYKEYRLGTIGYGTLREDLESWWAKVNGKNDPNSIIGMEKSEINNSKHILAIDNINLEVKKGERLGIIGKNGAGKTTLLKILSRISSPTKGIVKIKGSIASLLAVGTGFHPELTGRENIYLNGTILGLKRIEINRSFDEIVDFAGVEEFIDTPVKRYSSGMNVRLAFAVAAHLNPDILIIDEVLAVGDAEFQKKALGKMEDVSSEEGRTILFVSHNMSMITSLCKNAILLESGKIIFKGKASDTVKEYYKNNINNSKTRRRGKNWKNKNTGKTEFISGYILNNKNKITQEIDIRQSFRIIMKFMLNQDCNTQPIPNFHILDHNNSNIFSTSPYRMENNLNQKGLYKCECQIPGRFFNNGIFYIDLALTFMDKGVDISFYHKTALTFTIIDPIEETLYTERNGYANSYPGPLRPRLEWKTEKVS